jgi:hypothetical protein
MGVDIIERGDVVCLPRRICPRSTQRHPSPLPEQSIIVENLIGNSGAICCWQDKNGRWYVREFPVKMLRLARKNPDPANFSSPRLGVFHDRNYKRL